MVRLSKLYTRSGDGGDTYLATGEKVSKHSPVVQALGDVDELNCWIGAARTAARQTDTGELAARLAQIQNELFDLGAELSTLAHDPAQPPAFQEEQLKRLERWIDEYVRAVPELTSFVLPGGTALNGNLHLARAVCRRAERSLVALAQEKNVPARSLVYLNRLGDLLFAMARDQSRRSGTPEYLWEPRKKPEG